MKYRCIELCADEYPIRMMSRLLEVSPSGYYEWRKHQQSARSQHNQQLVGMIREIHRESDGTYGSPRVLKELRERGQPVGGLLLLARLGYLGGPLARGPAVGELAEGVAEQAEADGAERDEGA